MKTNRTNIKSRKATFERLEHIDTRGEMLQLSFLIHYENTPIQVYRKFHLQKLKIFR